MNEELTRADDTELKWREFFVQVLNGDEISEIGGDVRKARIGENERVARKGVREKIMDALKKKQGGKAVSMDSSVA